MPPTRLPPPVTTSTQAQQIRSGMQRRRAAILSFALLFLLLLTLNYGFDANLLLHRFFLSDKVRNRTESSKRRLYDPVAVLKQYQRWHGVDALLAEHHADHAPNSPRKFAVVYLFPCAARAGNQLHNFYNSLLWSIITNRTALVQFASPTSSLCAQQPALPLAPWLPRWDDWAAELLAGQLQEDDEEWDDLIIRIPIDTRRERYDRQHTVVQFPQISDLLPHIDDDKSSSQSSLLMMHGRWVDHPTNFLNGGRYIANMEDWHKQIATALYREGPDFLRGMLFRHCFPTLGPNVDKPLLPMVVDDSSSSSSSSQRLFSLALHSRHTVAGDTGEFVQEEMDCLSELLPQHRTLDTCVVCIMSDRILTVRLLSEWLWQQNCTPVSSLDAAGGDARLAHGSKPSSRRGGGLGEHGERPAFGFLDDLGLCSRARNGVIGDIHRSSYMLLQELIEYDRQSERDPDDEALPPLLQCEIKYKSSEGYDYGKGTPTFRHWSKQKLLDPVEIFKQYKEWHSVEALERQRDHRQYAIAFLAPDSCVVTPGSSSHPLFSFFNQVVWSVMTNRTVLWAPSYDDSGENTPHSCNDLLQISSWIPSYEQWTNKLQLPALNKLQQNESLAAGSVERFGVLQTMGSWSNQAIASNARLAIFPFQPDKIDDQDGTIKIQKKLYKQGADFLYGMLFEETILLADSVRNHVPPSGSKEDPDSLTIALDDWKNDNDKLRETDCLDEILSISANSTAEKHGCNVFLMSESPTTKHDLQNWLSNRNCSTWTIASSSDASLPDENENADFFRNLILASRARTALVGREGMTSSELLVSRIEYKRQQEIWRLGRDPPLIPKLQSCFMGTAD